MTLKWDQARSSALADGSLLFVNRTNRATRRYTKKDQDTIEVQLYAYIYEVATTRCVIGGCWRVSVVSSWRWMDIKREGYFSVFLIGSDIIIILLPLTSAVSTFNAQRTTKKVLEKGARKQKKPRATAPPRRQWQTFHRSQTLTRTRQ